MSKPKANLIFIHAKPDGRIKLEYDDGKIVCYNARNRKIPESKHAKK